MSDVVNGDDPNLLAAEYVLGTLEADERTRASGLLDVDHQFRSMVSVWECRLGELHLMVEPVEPDPKIWDRIKAQIEPVTPVATSSAEVMIDSAAADQNPPEPEEAIISELTPPAANPAADPESGEARLEAIEGGAELVESQPQTAGETEDAALAKPPERIAGEGSAVLVAGVAAADEPRPEPDERARLPRPRVGRWRALAALMTLVALSLAALIAAWRYIPDRLPPQLRPAMVLNIPAAPTDKKPAPPVSQFEE